MERTGPSPAAIVDTIHDAGGIASLAHPGVTRRDELIAPLAAHGMDAIEVFHSDHTPEDQRTYFEMAQRLGLLISGGSDFHGDDPATTPARTSRSQLGLVALPRDAFAALEARASG